MTFFCRLALAAAALAVALAAGLHPEHGPLPSNPLAAVGLGLIGLGLIRHARESFAAD
ncbi:MAG: hypothetical protein AAFX76_03530 [Planctomycetota bacterium]